MTTTESIVEEWRDGWKYRDGAKVERYFRPIEQDWRFWEPKLNNLAELESRRWRWLLFYENKLLPRYRVAYKNLAGVGGGWIFTKDHYKVYRYGNYSQSPGGIFEGQDDENAWDRHGLSFDWKDEKPNIVQNEAEVFAYEAQERRLNRAGTLSHIYKIVLKMAFNKFLENHRPRGNWYRELRLVVNGRNYYFKPVHELYWEPVYWPHPSTEEIVV